MMHLRTPIVERPKETHTPPSGDRNTPTASSKFFKDVTGKGFRKFSSRLSRTPVDSAPTLSPEVGYDETFPDRPTKPSKQVREQLDIFKRRPKPLNLTPLTPPSSVKKKQPCDRTDSDLIKLESPIQLRFNETRKSSNYLAPPIEQDILSFHSNLFDPKSQFAIDSDDKPFGLGSYDEMTSPTCVMQMQRNMRRASGTKRYNSSSCSICNENIQSLLGGERVIELECSHQCHMDCFVAMMDPSSFKPPRCRSCGKLSNSVDEQTTQDLILRKMRQNNDERSYSGSTLFERTSDAGIGNSGKVVVQSLTANPVTAESKADRSSGRFATPRSQLIHTAQLSSNGLRDVFDYLDKAFDVSTPRNSIALNPLEVGPILKDELRVNLFPKLKRYTVNQNSLKIVFPHLLSVHLPKDDSSLDTKTAQIIMCISTVNCYSEHQSDQLFRTNLQKRVKEVLSSLREHESLGLTIVGRDGSGRAGCQGTFYGFVSKSWDGWDDIIGDLTIVNNTEKHIIPNPIWEVKEMLQTAERLLLTTMDVEESQIRHIVVLSGLHDPGERITKLEDNVYEQRITQLLEKMTSKYNCSVSQWISEDEQKPLLLSDYAPLWYYGISSEFFDDDSFNVKQRISKLRKVSTSEVSVTVRPADDCMTSIHTVYFNGSLLRCEGKNKNEVQLQLGPFGYGQFKSIIVEVEVDVPLMQRRISQFGNSISLLTCAVSQDPEAVELSESVSIELHPTCSSPALSQTTSLFHVSDADADENANENENENEDVDADADTSGASLYLDLPLVPSSSPSCDTLFVTKQIQLMLIESLRKLVTDPAKKTGTVPENTIKELTTVVYGMSRDCSSTNSQKQYSKRTVPNPKFFSEDPKTALRSTGMSVDGFEFDSEEEFR
ncbi:unnamed protein product [Kluyveromyces dobzhanskii CBS 2104]|uniref:WGS project CCBQ000000000 data, contig 00041 n=1 Tax=Kluyveromyces dobzhanskii CBS 2104 TaxID=1427455 RepID=A0A0A8L042_9SACH|nr:unnamed protein product [Kluyveromyces dobzhanskii CBS 2104]